MCFTSIELREVSIQLRIFFSNFSFWVHPIHTNCNFWKSDLSSEIIPFKFTDVKIFEPFRTWSSLLNVGLIEQGYLICNQHLNRDLIVKIIHKIFVKYHFEVFFCIFINHKRRVEKSKDDQKKPKNPPTLADSFT